MSRKRYFEDFTVGERFHFGPYTMSEAEIIDFAQRYDPQPFHTDPIAAENSPLGRFCASGLHTLSVVQKLCAEGLYNRTHLIAGRAINNLKFLQPVEANDAIHATIVVTATKHYPRLRHGLIQLHGEAFDPQKGPVLRMDCEFLATAMPQ